MQSQVKTTTITTRKASRKNRRAARRGAGRVTVPRVMNSAKLSPCATLYLRALTDPFYFLDRYGSDPHLSLPCIPCSPARRTEKLMLFARGFVSTSTVTGAASIMMSPHVQGNNFLVNETGNLIISNVNSTAAYFPVNFTQAQCVNLNGPLTREFFQEADNLDSKFRVVGMGIRVRYFGTELNRGGLITTLSHPDGHSLVGMDISGLLAYDQSRRYPVSRGWHQVIWTPTDSDECDLQTNPPVTADLSTLKYPLGLLIVGPDGSNITASFEYEAIQLVEYVGKNSRSATKNPLDPVGTEAARAAAGDSNVSGSFTQKVGKAIEYVKESSGPILQQVGTAVLNAGMDRLLGPAKNTPTLRITENGENYTVEHP